MILRELPDLPPRPLTRTNAQFRADFYARWGQENAIVSGRARHAEYATLTQTLSIKTARGGSETYAMGKRRLRVDDDSYLILNEGQTYSSVLQGDREAFSFCIFFRPGMADEVLGAMSAPLSQAADEGLHCARRKSQFAEHLRSHDHVVTPVLTQLARDASAGIDHADELEEALQNLLQRMIAAEHRVHTAERLIASVKPATRAELLRRVCWAADFICSNYANPITLDDMAAAASLSKFHLVRLFRQIHSVSPHQFLIKEAAGGGRAASGACRFESRRSCTLGRLRHTVVAVPASAQNHGRKWGGVATRQRSIGGPSRQRRNVPQIKRVR